MIYNACEAFSPSQTVKDGIIHTAAGFVNTFFKKIGGVFGSLLRWSRPEAKARRDVKFRGGPGRMEKAAPIWYTGRDQGNGRKTMPETAYQILARSMRYVFLLLGILAFLLALLMMRRESRQWRKEKRQLPDSGRVGEAVDEDSMKVGSLTVE